MVIGLRATLPKESVASWSGIGLQADSVGIPCVLRSGGDL